MPRFLRARIICFYCGKSSQHRKGDAISHFQCGHCEGTNFLDENGDIADVPAQDVETPRKSPARNGLPTESISQPRVQATNSQDSLFCSRCLTNQHFLAECLANYLPDDDDPSYAQFEANYPSYKQDLEKRYPPVCPTCEPRVRNHLKKSSYVAKSDILAKALKHDAAGASPKSFYDPPSFLLRAVLVLTEVLWISAILTQAVWHLLEARQAFTGGRIERLEEAALDTDTLGSCMSSLIRGDFVHQACHVELARAAKGSIQLSALLLWWNPTLLRRRLLRRRGYLPFYCLQATVLGIRYLAWRSLSNRLLALDRPTCKAAHAFCLAVLAMDIVLSYRVIVQVAKRKIEFRSLDAPLVEQDNQQDLLSTLTRDSGTAKPNMSNISISNLRPRRDFSPGISARSSGVASTATWKMETPRRTVLEDADAMEWEPSQTTPSSSFRPRSHAQPHQTPQNPVAPALSSQTKSPFYGTLPPAPQSLNARLRGAAQKQPAPFKPTTPTKQADWFKRMGLAQSQTSWANKEYVRRVTPPPEQRGMELQPGKLSLEKLGLAKDDGTGLEEIFDRTFRLGDSPEGEEQHRAAVRERRSTGFGRFELGVVAVPVLASLWLGLSYMIPSLAEGVSGGVYRLAQASKEMVHGR